MKRFLLSSFLFAAVASAQDAGVSQAIDLIADKGSYDQQAGVAVYEGNVKVVQGIATIWADKLTIYLKNNTAERIEAIGNPVEFEYKGEKQPVYGEGKKVIYDVLPKVVSLSGNALVKQGKDTIKGTKLTYDLVKENIAGSRVQMSFLPAQK